MAEVDLIEAAREAKAIREAETLTSERVKHLAGKALHEPGQMTIKEIQELAGSVLRHIGRRTQTCPPSPTSSPFHSV